MTKVSKNKHFQLEEVKASILAENLPFLDSAEDFLKQYGGLYFTRYELTGPVEVAHFDAGKAVRCIDCRWFSEYAKRIGEDVTPIGECSQGHASLMIDKGGSIYAGYDDWLGKIADSPDKAILNLVTREWQNWESIQTKPRKLPNSDLKPQI